MLERKTAENLYDSGKEVTVAKLIEQDTLIDELKSRIDSLNKNSSNSSKPPSSDIVKKSRAERRRAKKKRKKGGQLGHPRHERISFPAEEINQWHTYKLTSCPDCGSKVKKCEDIAPHVLQQVQFPVEPIIKVEHQEPAYWCSHCQKVHYGRIPDRIRQAGLFDADVSALVCWLKFAGNVSLSKIKRLLHDKYQVKVSRGYLCKVINKGARALETTYNELLFALRDEDVVNADETGHKNNGKRHWTWVFRTSLYALFKISPSRGSQVIIDVLGKEFNGVLGCDYFSAYQKYMKDFNIVLQLCLAHLIRDVKALVDSHDKALKNYGNKILTELKNLFHVIHRRDNYSDNKFIDELEKCKKAIIKAATGYVPMRRKAQNMAKRFRKHGKQYFTFITTPKVDPTNNCAEQAIRFVVMYRHVSQGTRSENGMIACERFFTVIASCALQGKSAFNFIKETFRRYFNKLPAPTLVPLPEPST